MANEITLNPSEAIEGELTADEQESLEIGERLFQEEQKLLAGKYRSPEELEKGYIELQKRLGEQQEDQPKQQEEEPKEEEEAVDNSLYETILESYRNGEWSEDVIKQVEDMNPVDVVNMFLSNQQEQSSTQATSDEIEQIQNSVGGSKDYQQMIQWAGQNLNEQEISMYDAVMEKGDPLAMFFAVQALNYRYQDSIGVDGQLLSGTAPRNTSDYFRSQAELVAAMDDPRYDKDPAYRQDVFDKLDRSNLQF